MSHPTSIGNASLPRGDEITGRVSVCASEEPEAPDRKISDDREPVLVRGYNSDRHFLQQTTFGPTSIGGPSA
jgi:hypothetical protein